MRVIARLDIKNDHVIKGIHLEGLRKVGDPLTLAQNYYQNGVDEMIFMDAVASLYDRNNLFHVIEKACEKIFVPLTIGGGLRTIDDIRHALNAGADKVAINTAATHEPHFISEAANRFGSQAIVTSIEAKKRDGTWYAYRDNGREPTPYTVVEWASQLQTLGAGEILLTSVDLEGTKKGFDLALFNAVASEVTLPVVLSGGYGVNFNANQLHELIRTPNAIAVAGAFHYGLETPVQLKTKLRNSHIQVREC